MGKIAEWACYRWLCTYVSCPEAPPDMEIYKAKDKSFDADLVVDGVPIHVKSMTVQSAERWGLSWVFDINDDLEGWMALWLINREEIELLGLLPVDAVNEFWSPTRKTSLKTKKVLYYDDIKHLNLMQVEGLRNGSSSNGS